MSIWSLTDLQCLLEVIGKEAVNIDMLFSTNKTVFTGYLPGAAAPGIDVPS